MRHETPPGRAPRRARAALLPPLLLALLWSCKQPDDASLAGAAAPGSAQTTGATSPAGPDPTPQAATTGQATPDAPDAAPGQPLDLGAFLDAHAADLPEDTLLLTQLDLAGLLRDAQALMPPRVQARLTEARRAALLADLTALFKGTTGLDLTRARWAVLGVAQSGWDVVFIGGDGLLPDDAQPLEVEGLEGARTIKDASVVFVPFEGGLMLLGDAVSAARLVALRERPETSLADEARRAPWGEAYGLVGPGRVVTLAMADNPAFQSLLKDLVQVEPTGARWLAFSHGPRGTHLRLRTNATEAALLRTLFAGAQGQLKGELMRARESMRFGLDLPEQLGVVLTAHMIDPLFEAYAPTVEGDDLVMHIEPLPPALRLAATTTLTHLAITAMGDVARSLHLTAAPEHVAHLEAIAAGAERFFDEHHERPDGTLLSRSFPLTEGPVCTAGAPSLTMHLPSATDWRQQLWQDLNFTITRPHRFRYCYESRDGSLFVAWAEASVNTPGAVELRYEVRGNARQGPPVRSEIEAILETPRQDATPPPGASVLDALLTGVRGAPESLFAYVRGAIEILRRHGGDCEAVAVELADYVRENEATVRQLSEAIEQEGQAAKDRLEEKLQTSFNDEFERLFTRCESHSAAQDALLKFAFSLMPAFE